MRRTATPPFRATAQAWCYRLGLRPYVVEQRLQRVLVCALAHRVLLVVRIVRGVADLIALATPHDTQRPFLRPRLPRICCHLACRTCVGGRCGAQHLLHSAPNGRGMARFVYPRLATLLKERRAVGSQGISREKNHPLAQVGMLTTQGVVEIWPIESWHMKVAEDYVIAMRLEVRQGELPIGRRVHGATIMAQ